ncbi:MAG: hypothetical protein CM15mP33_02450 [Candidatus Neomarinimicrobiota bacterium]|nr:MAG: hypothetical protein CM15mP33_02450 [Candidatus Neomarinimicrobiota bacterium]
MVFKNGPKRNLGMCGLAGFIWSDECQKAELKPKMNLVAIAFPTLIFKKNSAYKPGDILTAYNGKI